MARSEISGPGPRCPRRKIRHQRPLVVTSFLARPRAPGPGPGPGPRAPAPGPGPGPKECAGRPRNAKECPGVGGPGGRGAGADCGHAASGLRPSRMLFLRMYIPCRNPHMKKVSRHAAAAARFGTAPPRAMRNKKKRRRLEPKVACQGAHEFAGNCMYIDASIQHEKMHVTRNGWLTTRFGYVHIYIYLFIYPASGPPRAPSPRQCAHIAAAASNADKIGQFASISSATH